MMDITDSKSIVYGGIAKVEFDCGCGQHLAVWSGDTCFCTCGEEYHIGIRLYQKTKVEVNI